MALPRFLQPYLASYDIFKLNKNDRGVKNEIISQVLNLGSDEAVRWVFKNYSQKEIEGAVRNPQRGVWFKKSLDYWKHIFDIGVLSSKYERAIINMSP